MEITKREILLSIAFVSFMLVIGMMISGNISNQVEDQNMVFRKAIHIQEEALFKQGMKTNVGNAFVYGELIATDPVTFDELDDSYLTIKKIKERYTRHTREVTYTDSEGKKRTKTEVYWTWDEVGEETKKSKEVTFLNIPFNSNHFLIPSLRYLKTIQTSPHIRYQYYAYPAHSVGTIFSYLGNSTIADEVSFFENMTTQQAFEAALRSGTVSIICFWVTWIILIGALVAIFYYLENKWLY